MNSIQLTHPSAKIATTISLAASKSESNRALIIQALAKKRIKLNNLSAARDTQTMIRLLKSKQQTLNVLDAGTTMRFLVAYCAANNRDSLLTGTKRMKERPIKILVEALKTLGADIVYLENQGFPPVHIKSFIQKTNHIKMTGEVSSQYISALLMIAPTLPLGIHLTITGAISSRPYIEMTLQLMQFFGVGHTWSGQNIQIEPQSYSLNEYTIESDWSGASYWYSIAALAKEADITLSGLKENSLQGDAVIAALMERLGVTTFFEEGKVRLQKTTTQDFFDYDFTHCPDLVQTVAVICAAQGVEAKMSGLKSLRLKETDRIAAIQQELNKLGVKVVVTGDDELYIPKVKLLHKNIRIRTYGDHRMAMAFAPLTLVQEDLIIDDPEVVSKSYPRFWDDLKKAGFVFV